MFKNKKVILSSIAIIFTLVLCAIFVNFTLANSADTTSGDSNATSSSTSSLVGYSNIDLAIINSNDESLQESGKDKYRVVQIVPDSDSYSSLASADTALTDKVNNNGLEDTDNDGMATIGEQTEYLSTTSLWKYVYDEAYYSDGSIAYSELFKYAVFEQYKTIDDVMAEGAVQLTTVTVSQINDMDEDAQEILNNADLIYIFAASYTDYINSDISESLYNFLDTYATSDGYPLIIDSTALCVADASSVSGNNDTYRMGTLAYKLMTKTLNSRYDNVLVTDVLESGNDYFTVLFTEASGNYNINTISTSKTISDFIAVAEASKSKGGNNYLLSGSDTYYKWYIDGDSSGAKEETLATFFGRKSEHADSAYVKVSYSSSATSGTVSRSSWDFDNAKVLVITDGSYSSMTEALSKAQNSSSDTSVYSYNSTTGTWVSETRASNSTFTSSAYTTGISQIPSGADIYVVSTADGNLQNAFEGTLVEKTVYDENGDPVLDDEGNEQTEKVTVYGTVTDESLASSYFENIDTTSISGTVTANADISSATVYLLVTDEDGNTYIVGDGSYGSETDTSALTSGLTASDSDYTYTYSFTQLDTGKYYVDDEGNIMTDGTEYVYTPILVVENADGSYSYFTLGEDGTTTAVTVASAVTLTADTVDISAVYNGTFSVDLSSYVSNAADVGGVTFTATDTLPTGLALDTSTGIISGTPEAFTDSFSTTVTVTAGNGTTATITLSIVVAKATANVSIVSGEEYTNYTETTLISDIDITTILSADINGTFAWTTATTELASGDNSLTWSFTPDDATNYETLTGTVTIKTGTDGSTEVSTTNEVDSNVAGVAEVKASLAEENDNATLADTSTEYEALISAYIADNTSAAIKNVYLDDVDDVTELVDELRSAYETYALSLKDEGAFKLTDLTSYDFIFIESGEHLDTIGYSAYSALCNAVEKGTYVIVSAYAGSDVEINSADEGTSSTVTTVTSPSAKAIADIINAGTYRNGSDNKYRVLEIQPNYPIDIDVAEGNTTVTGGWTKHSDGTAIEGDYYTTPSDVVSGSAKEELADGTEYYDFDLTKAKIAYAIDGVSYSDIELTQVSTDQLIGMTEDIAATYDLVYIGGDISAMDRDVEKYYNTFSFSQGVGSSYQYMLPIFIMYTHTGTLAQCYAVKTDRDVVTGSTMLATPVIGSTAYTSTVYTVQNGNDLTYTKYEELVNYISSGKPIIISDELTTIYEGMNEGNLTETQLLMGYYYNEKGVLTRSNFYLDPTCRIYQLLKVIYAEYTATSSGSNNILWGFDVDDEDMITNTSKEYGNTLYTYYDGETYEASYFESTYGGYTYETDSNGYTMYRCVSTAYYDYTFEADSDGTYYIKDGSGDYVQGSDGENIVANVDAGGNVIFAYIPDSDGDYIKDEDGNYALIEDDTDVGSSTIYAYVSGVANATPDNSWYYETNSDGYIEYDSDGSFAISDDIKASYAVVLGEDTNALVASLVENSSSRVRLTMISSPTEYSEGITSTYLSTTNLSYTFMVSGDGTYTYKLYVDKDKNTSFDETNDYYMTDSLAGETETTVNLSLGEDFFGAAYWLIEIYDGDTIVASQTGISKILNETEGKSEINVLQVQTMAYGQKATTWSTVDSLFFDIMSQDAHKILKYNTYSNTTDMDTTNYLQYYVLGRHEYRFGIIEYDTSAGTDDHFSNLADEILEDYDVNLDMIMAAETSNTDFTTADGYSDSYEVLDTWVAEAEALEKENGTVKDTGYSGNSYTKEEYADLAEDTYGDYINAVNAVVEPQDALNEYLNGAITYIKTGENNTEYDYATFLKGFSASGDDVVELLTYLVETSEYSQIFFAGYSNNTTSFDSDATFQSSCGYGSEFVKLFVAYRDAKNEELDLKDQYQTYLRRSYGSDFLKKMYSILILGPSEGFGGFSVDVSEDTCKYILDFVQNGGDLFFFHDTMTPYADAGAVELTTSLLDVVGMNRFHVDFTDQSNTYEVNSDTSYNTYSYTAAKEEGLYYEYVDSGDTIYVEIPDTDGLSTDETTYTGYVKSDGTWSSQGVYYGSVSAGGTVYYEVSGSGLDTSAMTYTGWINYLNTNSTVDVERLYDTNSNSYKYYYSYTTTSDTGGWILTEEKTVDVKYLYNFYTKNYGYYYAETSSGKWGYKYYEDSPASVSTSSSSSASTVDLVYKSSNETLYYMTPLRFSSDLSILNSINYGLKMAGVGNTVSNGTGIYVSALSMTYLYQDGNQGGGTTTLPYIYAQMSFTKATAWASDANTDQSGTSQTVKASQLNEGLITLYPFKIGSSLNISGTHQQAYALDLEGDDVTVWYTLAGSNNVSNAKIRSSLYAADPYDAMENYFIYTTYYGKGAITYCGAGHASVTGKTTKNNDERKLFINVIVNSAEAVKSKPTLKLYQPTEDFSEELDKDSDLTSSTGKTVYLIETESKTDKVEFDIGVTIPEDVTVRYVNVYFDLDWSESSTRPTYNSNEDGDVLIWKSTSGTSDSVTYFDDSDTLKGIALRDIQLSDSYFTYVGSNYAYIVVEVYYNDSTTPIYSVIKVKVNDTLFELTEGTYSIDLSLTDAIDEEKFKLS